MSYKGTLRSLNAIIKRADREQKQHHMQFQKTKGFKPVERIMVNL